MNEPSFRSRLMSRFLRLFFSLLYHKIAWSYDFIAAVVSVNNWISWISTVIPELNGPEVLELGHGTGHLQIMLQKAGLQSIGVDESPQMGILASRKLQRENTPVRLVRSRAQLLPFEKETFQQVVTTFPSEYILDRQSLSEAFRVLDHGGKLVILPLAWITGSTWIERAAAWLFKVTGQAPDWDDSNLDPFRKFGFRPMTKHSIHPSWKLVTIIAEKPPLPTI